MWEWKRNIFLTNNPGLEQQFSELSLASVRNKIQVWLDRQGGYPKAGAPEEYGFYIEKCYPIDTDRRAFFQAKIRLAEPHIGYRLLCHLAQADIIRAVWSTNFDGLPSRAAGNFKLTPFEVGVDSQGRLPRVPAKGDLLCVSLHGDYRYDRLKNTPDELQRQETALAKSLIEDLRNTPLIVCGYSGRDASVMDALLKAYSEAGTGALYWCGFAGGDIPDHVAQLIEHARSKGRQAYYVFTQGFDDLLGRLSLHCLEGASRDDAAREIANLSAKKRLDRAPFQLPECRANTLIKSNAFEIDCPSEVLQFDLKVWPTEKVWSWVREKTKAKPVVAVPFKGKILALGTIDDIKSSFGENIKGAIERTPVSTDELRYEDGAVVSLMREALVRSVAAVSQVHTDGRSELWFDPPVKKVSQGGVQCHAFQSVVLFLRRIGAIQYLVLKPSIKVLDHRGQDVPYEIAGPVKLGILGYQHNKPFNQAVNAWRDRLLKDRKPTFEFPVGVGSTFKFIVRRSPIFGKIGLPSGGQSPTIADALQPLLKHRGLQLQEPPLIFSNKAGNGTIRDTHPIRGMVDNRPFDFPLTLRGLSAGLRIGIVCPHNEARPLQAYLAKAHQTHRPGSKELDYLVDFPGFQAAYGVPIQFPEPDQAGWAICPEPSHSDPLKGSVELATQINHAIEMLQSTYAPHVVLIYFPDRWNHLRGYRVERERFDVHDFVKAFCVQKGIATQFLNEHTTTDLQQARVWWWLSLALYVKAMRTPWVLDGVDNDTAFVGLGFTIDSAAEKGNHVVLGCSHIYSSRGEGLQYRLSKVEDPIIKRGNPFMSRDDAQRVGETIRQLFFDARSKLPRRVVMHKRTPFLKDEREGLLDGLSGIEEIDLLEIQKDDALRYVASVAAADGSVDEDNYPVRRGTVMKLDDFSALLWVHGTTDANNPRFKYYQGKRRIPSPLTLRRHAGSTDLKVLAEEILGLSKMNWNTFDFYTKLPATLQSSSDIARIGSLLRRFGAESYDYRLFI